MPHLSPRLIAHESAGHSAIAKAMTIEALRFSLMARGARTAAGHLRPATPGETRAMQSELARRVAAEAPIGGE